MNIFSASMRSEPMSRTARFLALLALAFAPLLVAAHGLLLDAETDGDTIFGAAYYSNGERAVSETIELLDLTAPGAAPVSAQTDSDGNFKFDVVRSHRYRVSVFGDEGHSVEVEVVAEPKALPKLIDEETEPTAQLWPPPAWAIIGGVLLLSLIPAIAFRRGKAS